MNSSVKKLSLSLAVLISALSTSSLRADPVDSYVGLLGSYLNYTGGARKYVRVEFARLSSYVSLDLRLGTGDEYKDYGGAFRVFKHFNFDSGSGTGVSVGLGVGASFAPSATPANTTNGALSSAGATRGFTDPFAAPFVRFVWDVGSSIGVLVDAEYVYAPARYFMGTDGPRSQSTIRSGMGFSLGVAFEI